MISNGLTQSLPLKFFYAGPMFRYERPQKGRMRQFHQIGIEYLGPRDGLADAEIIACGARVLARSGCSRPLSAAPEFARRRREPAGLSCGTSGIPRVACRTVGGQPGPSADQPAAVLDSKDAGDRAILENAPRLDGYLNDVSKRHFAAVTGALDSAGIDWTFDPLLVRGLDYYCHTAFEFITDALGAQGTVLGGGRYDGLSEMLGGPPVAGVGWAAGVERLSMLVGEQEPATPPVAILPMDEDGESEAHRLAEMLRDNGVAVDLSAGGAIGKRLKKADRAGARLAVILGSDELAAGTAQLRDLATGTQSSIAQADLAAALHAALAGADDGAA